MLRTSTFTAFRCISTTASLTASNKKVIPPEPGLPLKKDSFYYKDLEISHASPSQLKTKPTSYNDIKFGHCFSDYMMEVDWNLSQGWSNPQISPFHNFSIHPAANVLHYAIELFEGMKAYRGVDNKIRLFRPEQNMARMKKSASRASLPDFDTEELIKIISEMVKIDKEWVPYSDTASLYIRPTMIGIDPSLGVHDPTLAKLFVIAGPVGSYFPTGFKPISLLADSQYIRAFPGGVGAYKMGCNYAPTIFVGKIAASLGCQNVLWLSDKDEKLTEAGTMNIFVYWINEHGEHELVTPPLAEGLILPGVTRESLIDIAKKWNEFKVSERYPTMEEIRRAIKEKRMLQLFGAGTACVVSPVGSILYKNPKNQEYEELVIPTMDAKPNIMKRFYDTIMDIQYGKIDWPGWTRTVE